MAKITFRVLGEVSAHVAVAMHEGDILALITMASSTVYRATSIESRERFYGNRASLLIWLSAIAQEIDDTADSQLAREQAAEDGHTPATEREFSHSVSGCGSDDCSGDCSGGDYDNCPEMCDHVGGSCEEERKKIAKMEHDAENAWLRHAENGYGYY